MTAINWLVLVLALGWPLMFWVGTKVEQERRRSRLTHTR